MDESIEKKPNQEDDFVNGEFHEQNNVNLESDKVNQIDAIQD